MVDTKTLIQFSKGEKYDQVEFYDCLCSITNLVISRFYKNISHDDEIYSIGIAKAIALLKSKHFNPEKNTYNFIFTGIRNEIQKYNNVMVREILVEPGHRSLDLDICGIEELNFENEIPEKDYGDFTQHFRGIKLLQFFIKHSGGA